LRMSFKKRIKNSNLRKRKRDDENNNPEEPEDQREKVLELVEQTKLVQQGRKLLRGCDMTPNREVKFTKSKNENDSDFASLKYGLNSLHPQIDLPSNLQVKMDAYIEERLQHLKGTRNSLDSDSAIEKLQMKETTDLSKTDPVDFDSDIEKNPNSRNYLFIKNRSC